MNSFSFLQTRWLLLAAVLAIGGLVGMLAGCDDTGVSPVPTRANSTQETDSDVPLPPDVRLRVQYDQTEVTYSNVWPGSIVGDNTSKKKTRAKKEGTKLMTEFEKTHEVRSYDDQGYLSASYEYLDGNHPGMNMPADAYSDLKGTMPYNSKDENPIVRSELRRSTIKHIRADGSEARSRPIDPEEFRIDPAKLDSLADAQEDSSDVDSPRSAVLNSLRDRGLSFRRLGENRVVYEQKVDEVRGTSSVKKVIDLRFGRPIYLKYTLKNGNTDMVETRQYARKSGLSVMMKSVTYNYDDRTGSWGVVSRTEVTRRNVSVQFN